MIIPHLTVKKIFEIIPQFSIKNCSSSTCCSSLAAAAADVHFAAADGDEKS
jgi:hypothetical protein